MYKHFESCDEINISHPVDIERLKKNGSISEFLAISQNISLRDPENEYMSRGKIYYFSMQNGKVIKTQQIEIISRDDFPFNPVAISSIEDKKKSLIYILNRVVSYQYSIDVFELNGNKMSYLYRLRPDRDIKPTDIFVLDDEIIYIASEPSGAVSNLKSMFFESYRKGLMVYRNENWKAAGFFRKVYQIEIDKSNNKIYLLSENSIELFSVETKKNDKEIQNINFQKEKPERISFEENELEVLLSDKKKERIVKIDPDQININIMTAEKGKRKIISFYRDMDIHFLIKNNGENLSACR